MSESDVENYKQIKSDLDELRLMVEKSELWVYKAKSGEGKKKKKEKEGDDKVSVTKVLVLVIHETIHKDFCVLRISFNN